MFSVLIGACLATALLLCFSSTRPLGAVGVFVLFVLEPLFCILLLGLCGFVYYLLFREKILPKGRPGERKRNIFPVVALPIVGGALALGYSGPTSENAVSKIVGDVRAAPRQEVIVLRTPGGLLEVSRIEATEMLDATIQHEIFGMKIGKTMPRIRVPATYRYHIPLEPEWRVVRADGVFTIVAPRIRPSLPVAVDFAGIQKDVAGSWILLPFTVEKDLDLLERSITRRLEQKAKSRDYIDRQREDARETVREFARKWLVEQMRWKDAEYRDIRVLFADEPVRSIESLAG